MTYTEQTFTKQIGREIAGKVADELDQTFNYVYFDDKYVYFQLTRWKTYDIIGPRGSVIQKSELTDDPFQPGVYPVYAEYRFQYDELDHENLVFMVKNGLTR